MFVCDFAVPLRGPRPESWEDVYKSGEHRQLLQDKKEHPALLPPGLNPEYSCSATTRTTFSQRHSIRITNTHFIMKSTILAFALTALVSAAPAPLVPRAPPGVPTTAAAKTQLAGLTVAAQGPQTGYSRDLFPHWITQSGTFSFPVQRIREANFHRYLQHP